MECAREAGTVDVANRMWRRLGMDEVLGSVGFSGKERLLTQVMVTNRLVSPSSEHAMPDWAERTTMGDILGADLTGLNHLLVSIEKTLRDKGCHYSWQTVRRRYGHIRWLR